MYTPTYKLINASNVALQNTEWFPLNNQSPNPGVSIQIIPTQGTGSATYTVYQTAFRTTGIITGQPYPFDITNLKYWQVVGTAASQTNQYLTIDLPASGLWVICTITGNATVEYSVLQRGMQ